MQGVTQICFGLSYLLALVLEIGAIRLPKVRIAGLCFGAAGLLAHTFFLALRQPSPATPEGSLLLLAWVLAVFYFYGTIHHRRQAWAIFVLPVVLGLVALAIVIDHHSDSIPVPTWLQGERFWAAIHGLLLLSAAVGISVCFLASVMYLFQSRRLRRKLPPLGGLHILSLERLDSMTRRATFAAVPLLTAGLMLGGFLLNLEQASVGGWLSLKILGTIGLWTVGVLLLVMRYAIHVPARRLAWLSILAFTLLVISLATAHPFAEVP